MVDPETPIARIHAASEEDAERARERLLRAYRIAETPADDLPLIRKRVGA